jgi:DNA-directed RNA polymerase subunit RPC12/RpoP/bacterioferritin-associated ferredoxin
MSNTLYTYYNYPCSWCKREFSWSVADSKNGRLCPQCRDEVFRLAAEEQEDAEIRLHRQMDDWWHGLSVQERENAFFSVVKRLYKAECVGRKSYRGVLYEEFGFGPEAYAMGISCNFLALHNCIRTHEELREMEAALREKKNREKELKEHFRIKSTCGSCGYQSMDLNPGLGCSQLHCEGTMK